MQQECGGRVESDVSEDGNQMMGEDWIGSADQGPGSFQPQERRSTDGPDLEGVENHRDQVLQV